MLDLSRRKFITGLGLIGIAPAIVKASSIMRIHEPSVLSNISAVELARSENGYLRSWSPVFRTSLPATSWRAIGFDAFESAAFRAPMQKVFDIINRVRLTSERQMLTLADLGY